MVITSLDPYDLWATRLGVVVRKQYYARRMLGKLSAVLLGLADWLAPDASRWLIGVNPRNYPIVVAHEMLRREVEKRLDTKNSAKSLACLRSVAIDPSGNPAWAWGLGFPWMSKNGLYESDIPFVTHTPYVMEALLALAKVNSVQDEAMQMFHGTWAFLQSLRVMYEDENSLALSYAPVDEPRIVVNANAYAAFAYALHAIHGNKEVREEAKKKVLRLVRWVAGQQEKDGSWFYYADKKPCNFIDCFHSCFVVKNLLKVKWLIPEVSEVVMPIVKRGWAYIRSELYDSKPGLCRRFAKRAQRDPFRWDLYDQAEYLGLLVDFGLLEEAREFRQRVEFRFRKGKHWYCRIDIFGRRWGKDFLRWGIVPFWYHKARLVKKQERFI